MTNQPPGTPWRGQHHVPPPPTPASPAATVELPVARARRWWARLDPLPKTLLIIAAALPVLLFCGGLTVAAAVSGDPSPDTATASSPEPTASASASPSPTVVTRTITETEKIPFDEVTADDSSLLEGTQEVRTEGEAGELTITFEVTITNGEETDRRKVTEEVTREPVDQVIVVGTKQPEPEPVPEPEEESGCHPSYTGACVPTSVSDVDCDGGSGDGPKYVRGPVWVIGPDQYRLDRDGDGVACE
jgi:hypothetical protein